jgi:hypothetical protein
MQSFNTWSFKREQPDTSERLKQAVAKAVARDEPVPFVMYWGKGPRNTAAHPEAQTMDYFASMLARIRERYAPGGHLTLILTDTHARLNGHSEANLAQYFDAIRVMALARGFSTTRLSKLVEDCTTAPATIPQPEPALLRSLTRSAEKWHFGGFAPEAAARAYFKDNMTERAAVEEAYPDAIFATYNGSDLRALFPATMPIFYMYALKRGVAVKPWFMDA